MSYKYSWTITSNYHYDATLTQELLYDWLDDKKDSSGRDSHIYYLNGMGGLYVWPSSWEKQVDTSYHEETETEEPMDPPPHNVIYDNYCNFTAINGVDFTVASGLTDDWGRSLVPTAFSLDSNTSMTNVKFGNASIDAAGSGAKLSNLEFKENGGYVRLGGGFYYDENDQIVCVGGQSLVGLSAAADLDYLALDAVTSKSGNNSAVTASNVIVDRKMRELFVGGGSRYGEGANTGSGLTASGVVASDITVHGALEYVAVGVGATLDNLKVGDYKLWGADSHASAFLGEDVWGSTSHMSATTMVISSGGTANNINLGFGGSVTVLGPEDRVSSTYNSATSQWEVTTHYASGTGGVLTNLYMATSGGLMLEGGSDMRQKLWTKPYNYGYESSKTYKSGFIAGAPQSAYVQFDSNTSGNNINIGNGGELRISSGASVVGISMGGLVSSLKVVNSSGGTDTWIGDRGAKLTINGGIVSGVSMATVLQSFDYYSATHDYFWLYSSSLEREYYESHGSYGSGAAWSSSIYNSAVSGYSAYMRAQYTSGGHYTNLGDDTNGYTRMYVGGEITVNGGRLYNVKGFSYLSVAGEVQTTVSNHVSSWSVHQWTGGHVSKGSGAVSATLDVTDGAHVSNMTIAGGRVIMTAGGNANARWHGQENKQSNYNLVEDLDLRTADLVGDNNSAVIEFNGSGSGRWSQYVSSGGTSGYIDYFYDAMDPGEIHNVIGNSGLTVSGSYGSYDSYFTYTGKGSATINGLGTVVLKDNHSRCLSDSYYGKGPYLGSAFDTYYFGVVKGAYDEEDGVMIGGMQLDDARLSAGSNIFNTILDGSAGFDWTGTLAVGSGAIVRHIGASAGLEGGLKTANDIASDTWNPVVDNDLSKKLYVLAGGVAQDVKVVSAVTNYERISSSLYRERAGLLVSSGGTALDVTVINGGVAMADGGTINGAFVGNGGILYLSGWGGAHQMMDEDGNIAGPQYLDTTVLNNVHLDSGGHLYATYDYGFGGKAPSITANAGGGVLNGVTANGVAYVSGLDYAGTLSLASGQQAVDVTVRGRKTVTAWDSNGDSAAWTTTIGTLNVSSGGTATRTTVGEEGAIYASGGAVLNSTTLAQGGRLIYGQSIGWNDYFAGSATANGITIQKGGMLEINSKFALTANNMDIQEGAGMEFQVVKNADENHAAQNLNGSWTASWGNGTFQTHDGELTGFGGEFGYIGSNGYVSARLSATVTNGGVISGADLRGYGDVNVNNGGKLLDTKLWGVGANIGTSGYASGLATTISANATAYQTNVRVYGSGAVADATVISGGFLGVENGGVVNDTMLLTPEGYTGPAEPSSDDEGPAVLEIMEGGTANNTVASSGAVIALYGGSLKSGEGNGPAKLSNAEVHSGAMIKVLGDGGVLNGTVNLGGLINTTTKRYEWIEVEVEEEDPDNPGQTIKYTDWQRVEMNNSIADAATLTVNFDLTELEAPGETAMIDNLSNLTDVTLDRISVKADQAQGAYVLAGGSEDYKGSLKVIRDGSYAGTITVGGYLQVTEDLTYSLSNNTDDGLVFSVLSTDAAITNIIATSNGKELLKGKWSKYAINIKTEVNRYSKSIWYRIKKAIMGRGVDDEEGEWLELDNEQGITISEYCTVEFKAKNEKGVDSKIVTYTVNYDDTPATLSDVQFISDADKSWYDDGETCTVSVLLDDDLDDVPTLEVKTAEGEWTVAARGEDGRNTFAVMGNGDYELRLTDHAENVSETTITVDFYNKPVIAVANADRVIWSGRENAAYVVALSDDNGTATLAVTDTAVSLYNLPDGEYTLEVGYANGAAANAQTIVQETEYVPSVWEATDDSAMDAFFAQSASVWTAAYHAKHTGSLDGWAGTGETAELDGRNQMTDIFIGGKEDANILLLTDDANGDALFIDDVYSAFPEGLDAQARIAKIDEIRAGAGDDIVDLTSQRFDYVGGGMTVHGGLGDDVIWANNGDNMLFGDAGNDRIVGAGGNDIIVGGSGDDSLHGGGGEDIFVFGGNWGNDSVEQLADGKVTLWFDDGDESKWDASTLTYRDGDKSVAVDGVTAENITLKFGDDGSEQYGKLLESGAFDEFGSERIFENKNRGMLA